MLNLKECGDGKKGKKIDSATLMHFFCFLLVFINHYSGGINQYSEASIFQVDQLRLPEEDITTTDDYFNFGDPNNIAFSDYDYEYSKVVPMSMNLPIIDNLDYSDQFSTSLHQNQVTQSLTYQEQFQLLQDFNHQIQNKIIGGVEFFGKVLEFANQLKIKNFKSIPKINQNSQKQKKHIPKIKSDTQHKFMISKLESWDVHLKSIRTHFMQKIFHKIWKVPTQQIIKNHCFSGINSQQNKMHIIIFLQEELEEIEKKYSDFQLKQEIYLQIIQRTIFCLDLAMQLNNQADELIFDILFKGFIAELFHH